MKSYIELLEYAAMTPDGDTDIVTPVAKVLGLKRKETADLIGKMSIDDTLKLIDAVNRGDTGAILLFADQTERAAAKSQEGDHVESLQEAPINPMLNQPLGQPNQGQPNQQSGPPQANQPGQAQQQNGQLPLGVQPQQPQQPQQQQPQQQQQPPVQGSQATQPGQSGQMQGRTNQPPPTYGNVKTTQGTVGTFGSPTTNQNQNVSDDQEMDGDDEALAEEFSIGDQIETEDNEGIVRHPAAGRNGDFVGVLQDGNLTMVHKRKVKHVKESKLDEHVLGMTIMPDLRRMMELAGIQPDKANPETKKPWDKQEEAEQEEQQQPAQQAPQQQAPAQPKVQVQQEQQPGQIDITVHDIQTGETRAVAKTAAPSNATVSSPVAQAPEPVDPLGEVMSALDQIERNMPELKVGDYKAVRARLDKISNMIFESQINRRRKL